MADPLIKQIITQFRNELDTDAAKHADEMARRWLTVERSLEADITNLATQAANDAAAGKVISVATLGRMERYLKLMAQVQDQIARFSGQAATNINQLQQTAIAAGFQQSVNLINAATGAGPGEVIIQFDRLGVEAYQNVLALARAGRPLDNILQAAYPITANAITDRLLFGTAMGWNPRKTARSMVRDGLAQGLQHILLVSRDQQIRGFREAARQQYERSRVVKRYRRMAALQVRTCLACLALDGTIYDVAELMALHPQDRCSMVGIVEGFPEPQWKTGEEWFNEQPVTIQRQMLGPGKYNAWKDGLFEFRQLATIKDNPIWGPGARVTSLQNLLKGRGGIARAKEAYDH